MVGIPGDRITLTEAARRVVDGPAGDISAEDLAHRLGLNPDALAHEIIRQTCERHMREWDAKKGRRLI